MTKLLRTFLLTTAALLLLAAAAPAKDVVIDDPRGDDCGPCTDKWSYVYPTDAVYEAGSFDLTEFKMKQKKDKYSFEVTLASKLDDPWRMGNGFSVQMVFVFIDFDHAAGSGYTEVPPGLNFMFAEEDAWDACVILSPQGKSRVLQEIEAKAAAMSEHLYVPDRTRGSRSTISGDVKLEGATGDPMSWGYQVVVQSNEGFPAGGDLLTRKVNEFEGQHRFGGGTDYDCDPHVMDILGDNTALGDFECADDGTATKHATIMMVRP
jgi:carbohydrate-binding DOMON domain-containing protein